MKNINRYAALFASLAVVMGGCSAVRLNPYGLAYDETNVMDTGPLLACWAPLGFDTAPIRKFGTKPLYPIAQLLKGTSGDAEIRFSVDESGTLTVQRYESKESQSYADHAAIALRDWELLPAMKDGKPTAVTCKLSFSYKVV